MFKPNAALGAYLASIFSYSLDLVGDSIQINGVEFPGGATWIESTPAKIQTFVKDDGEWGNPIYDVTVNANALNAPWNAANGAEIIRDKFGWRGSVRRIDPAGAGDAALFVVLLVVISPQDG